METEMVPAGLPDIVRTGHQVEELARELAWTAEAVVPAGESRTLDRASEESACTAVQDNMVGYSVDTWFIIQ